MTIMTKEQVGAWCKEMADYIYGDALLLDIFTRAYCTEEVEPMNEVKALRLAAGLTQRELSELSLVDNLYTKTSYHSFYQQEITIPEIEAAELGLGEALTETQWGFMQSLCNNRINIFKRDAGLTIKLG
jgi:hypothetical protein